MNLGRKVTDGLWEPWYPRPQTIQVIERAEDKEEPEGETKKVPFGFSRAMEEDQ